MNDTRERLLAAARRLYAERGLDAVSLREINQAAGARNATAVQYHFGDRAGIVRAIFERHGPEVEARRHALLDAWEAAGEPDVRGLAAALVRPMAARLADPGGREFLQLWADAVNRPEPLIPSAAFDDPGDSLCRWRALVGPLLEEDAARLHRRFTAIQYALIELGRRARSGPHADDRLFTSYLIDVVAAMLSAPVSAETRRLAAERDAARGLPSRPAR
ncbi:MULTISPECIES: TetR/AcrR family transcriptional regulator [Actinomadura]|uniref:TetR/AcrR family transcriptional regulator n=1 Tax=Actinomadura yumaensis TaxID=111807 RepID=A0ABW2CXW3_9ACTN|nr:TetR/AcrR family transcriptional regulator [Actinomadura sp. J1-007]MWK40194.1 TetR family transcriptional regulator [Actinomadura sp. J1-007]